MIPWYKDEGFYGSMAVLLYAAGVPISFGMMVAYGVGPAAIVGSFFWPIIALAYSGYWFAV